MIKHPEKVKQLLAKGWVLSKGCSGGFMLVNDSLCKWKYVLPRTAKELIASGAVCRCDDRTSRVGARWCLVGERGATRSAMEQAGNATLYLSVLQDLGHLRPVEPTECMECGAR